MPGSDHQPEKRATPRFAFDARITIETLRPEEKHSFWGQAFELGQSGLRATVVGELQTGDLVFLKIPLPTGKSLEVKATVRYKRGYQCGFGFLTMSESQTLDLQRACDLLSIGY